ncbi:hypothetical protein EDD11_000362 [Mortierella claussenii]|nr:hypothetical protein EDD11_000362 [Mortierella claussenii]
MASPVAPPAAFGLISGTAFTSASPAALDEILDSLEVSSLEQEHSRLQRAVQQLEQSNREITQFIEQEQQELIAHYQQQREARARIGAGPESVPETQEAEENESTDPDPEFVLAIEENKVVIAKYQRTCEQLKSAIARRRGTTSHHVNGDGPIQSSDTDADGSNNIEEDPATEASEDGVFL